jgi:hypothetical protein
MVQRKRRYKAKSKIKSDRFQIRMSVLDKKLLFEYSEVAGVDPSQFSILLIRKYGAALSESLSRQEGETPRTDSGSEGGGT